MVRLVRTFFNVFQKERADFVMARRKKVNLRMYSMQHLWRITREGFVWTDFPGQKADENLLSIWADPALQDIDPNEGIDSAQDMGGDLRSAYLAAAKTPDADGMKLGDVRRKRRITKQLPGGKTRKRVAYDGERGGAPISCFASVNDLCTYFGLAIGMYFWTMQFFAGVFFLLFLVQLPVILHFAGPSYSNGQQMIDPRVRGTAVCNNTATVPATLHAGAGNATINDAISWAMTSGSNASWAAVEALGLPAGTTHTAEWHTHNQCYLDERNLGSAVASVVVLVVAFVFFRVHFKRMLVHVDARHSTAANCE
jgi:hypothetical protein